MGRVAIAVAAGVVAGLAGACVETQCRHHGPGVLAGRRRGRRHRRALRRRHRQSRGPRDQSHQPRGHDDRRHSGDGGAAADALFFQPAAITRCAPTGDLFVADTGNHRVRRVAADTGVVTTVLGDGVAASSGQGAPARTFPVDGPLGLACDPYGNLLVTSGQTVRLLPADLDHVVDGSGEVQSIYGAPPRSTFPASVTRCLTGLAIVDDDTAWVTDSCLGLLVELWRQPTPYPPTP